MSASLIPRLPRKVFFVLLFGQYGQIFQQEKHRSVLKIGTIENQQKTPSVKSSALTMRPSPRNFWLNFPKWDENGPLNVFCLAYWVQPVFRPGVKCGESLFGFVGGAKIGQFGKIKGKKSCFFGGGCTSVLRRVWTRLDES